ncbi:MAG: AAA family ATPase [Candidatus Izimaplasma sp.]|nr:AAA family ATPase [Candidatus Izimaplasma bacterium]
MIINVFGSSGSGTTTLAKAIADNYNFHHIDVDDIMWKNTDPPFSVRRNNGEIKDFMTRLLSENENVVISGSIIGIYDDLKPNIDLFIYINLDLETRIRRINEREYKRFGDRILPGGDLYDKHQDFIKWVSDYEHNPESLRSRRQHLSWLKDVKKPVLKITEELTLDELLKLVNSYIK